MNNLLILAACIVVSFALPNLLGASYKSYEQDWYKKLKRPKIALPDIVFIIIFPVFYLLEGIGLYYIFTNTNRTDIGILIAIYLLSAVLSGIWSRLFFIYKRCELSLVAFFLELPVTWTLFALLYNESHIAWIFFLPRVIWGFYAIFVNIQYYRLNKKFWDTQKK